MIIYWEGQTLPIEVQAGDMLFIAGRATNPPDEKLPFEHVAVVAARSPVSSHNDFLLIPVYGVPESAPKRDEIAHLRPSNAIFYKKEVAANNIGSVITVWNLAARHDKIDKKFADRIQRKFKERYGVKMYFHYTRRRPIVDPTLVADVRTNCLGFACSVLKKFRLTVLTESFPEYTNPYTITDNPTRDFPSPGHLAHALRLPIQELPYCPKDRAEAERFALAGTVLREMTTAPK